MNPVAHWRCFGAALILSVAAASSHAQNAQQLEQRLVGEWVGKDNGEKVVAIFSADHKATIIQPGAGIVAGRYTADFSAQPAALTIVADGYVGKTIIEFLSPRKLRIEELRSGGPPPARFENSHVLTRK